MEQERTREIKLGEHEYTVVAQRHAYLERKLGPQIGATLNLSAAEGPIAIASTGYHALLNVFIPELMPLWEWRGFASETAYTATELHKTSGGEEGSDQYDEAADRSPTTDQMVTAFRAVAEVNRIDLVEKLKELVGPDFFASDIWRAIRLKLEIAGIDAIKKFDLGALSSPSSPPPSGESDQTNGGTTVPTAAPSGAGPTPASSTT
jgi:hypothetical protein